MLFWGQECGPLRKAHASLWSWLLAGDPADGFGTRISWPLYQLDGKPYALFCRRGSTWRHRADCTAADIWQLSTHDMPATWIWCQLAWVGSAIRQASGAGKACTAQRISVRCNSMMGFPKKVNRAIRVNWV